VLPIVDDTGERDDESENMLKPPEPLAIPLEKLTSMAEAIEYLKSRRFEEELLVNISFPMPIDEYFDDRGRVRMVVEAIRDAIGYRFRLVTAI
jgi:hypothetical protein